MGVWTSFRPDLAFAASMTLYMTLSSSCRGLRVPRKMPCRPGNVLLAKSAALPSPARYQSSEARPRDPGLKPSPPTSPPDESRLPAWAAKYAYRFKNNPASHVTSFLILHELTAVLPLPILFWFFHSFDWTPESKRLPAMVCLLVLGHLSRLEWDERSLPASLPGNETDTDRPSDRVHREGRQGGRKATRKMGSQVHRR